MAARRTSVFERLHDPATYTGVYAQRFTSGPGINGDAADVTRFRCVALWVIRAWAGLLGLAAVSAFSARGNRAALRFRLH